MTMFASACSWNCNSDDKIVIIITIGFVGQLQGWWDPYHSEDQKNQIIFVRQPNLEGASSNVTEPDVVNTLIYTIMSHFLRSTAM